MTTITRQEYRSLAPKAKNKYGARKTILDGIVFDSKAEAAYYAALKLREKAGEVSAVELQKPFALLGPDGSLIATYKADFYFYDTATKRFRCIDVKGVETDVFKIKRKLMKACLGIDVETVK